MQIHFLLKASGTEKNYLKSLSQWLTEQGLGETKFSKWFKRRDIVETNDCHRPKGT